MELDPELPCQATQPDMETLNSMAMQETLQVRVAPSSPLHPRNCQWFPGSTQHTAAAILCHGIPGAPGSLGLCCLTIIGLY